MPNLIDMFLPVFGLLVLLAIVGGVVKILTARGRAPKGYPYEKARALFSPAERSFLGVLEKAVGNGYRVFGKVRLADVIRVRRGLAGSSRQSAFNRIQSKHLDFVVRDRDDMTVQFVVELDDRSHAGTKGQSRDSFVNEALAAAAVPLFRFAAKRAYSVQEIRNTIFRVDEEEATGVA